MRFGCHVLSLVSIQDAQENLNAELLPNMVLVFMESTDKGV